MQDIVDFLTTPRMLVRLGHTKPISLNTALRWLCRNGWRYQGEPKGQYVNRHKHEDVVKFWKNIFLPKWHIISKRLHCWTDDDQEVPSEWNGWKVVVWFYDKSIFYAHDCWKSHWVHKSKGVKPYAKGKGLSLMCYWQIMCLQTMDGCVYQMGASQHMYCSNQRSSAMDILLMKTYLAKPKLPWTFAVFSNNFIWSLSWQIFCTLRSSSMLFRLSPPVPIPLLIRLCFTRGWCRGRMMKLYNLASTDAGSMSISVQTPLGSVKMDQGWVILHGSDGDWKTYQKNAA